MDGRRASITINRDDAGVPMKIEIEVEEVGEGGSQDF